MALFWFKFEWDAWRNDRQLRRCSKEARGFWIDCIAEMESQQTYFLEGTPEDICRDVVATREEFDRSIAELSRTGAANIEECQGVVKIVSRRLLRKLNLTEYNRLKQQEHRVKQASNSGQDPPSKDKSFRALDSPIGEEQDAPPPEPKAAPKRLLSADFAPTPEMRSWAEVECPNLDLDSETEEFVVFWRDIATKNNKRTERGWNATWKKRMKEQQAKTNGTTRTNYRQQRADEARSEYEFESELRERVERRKAELPGSPVPDNRRQLPPFEPVTHG